MSILQSAVENKWSKACLIVGGCAVVGLSAYKFFSYYQKKNRLVDEGFEEIPVVDDSVKKIVVLGLKGTGKSTFISQLSKTPDNNKILRQGRINGLSILSLQCGSGMILNFAEMAGSESIRIYWSNLLQDTDLLIYLVDSTDEHRLADSVKELRIVTACDKLRNLRIIILANKQDLQNAASPKEVEAAFGIPELSNRIEVFPLEMPPDVDGIDQSLLKVKNTVIMTCMNK
ncbi:ADP-ribosylation factor-like protein 3 [Nephila pilipes]|uniref:ADP-ribosylation factor-like protein 3 n=1 Tax=Nephila pilipes TaxID=299642 RepID=A0A8X6N9V0_NEPPI|nr:ADP-ribosylation factor-like protein 3 [Nephila pilipes]